MVLILVAVALAPCLFLLWYFYTRDKYEPEPKKLILRIFFLGAVFVIPAGVVEYLLLMPLQKYAGLWAVAFLESFFIVAPIEEVCKFLVVKKWIYGSLEFDEVMDGVVYGVAASLGFAALENIFYVVESGIGVGIMRALLSVPGHAFFGAILGYWLGMARFNKDKEKAYLTKGVLLAVFFHGLFNFLLLTRSVLSLLVFGLILFLAFRVRKNLRKAAVDSRSRAEERGLDG
jgi:RsiW-degrading membrane proteinase PrsW (M82 family)